MAEYKFNPNEHLMQLQGKDYLEVKWRLVWFRNMFPNGSIETEMLMLDLDRETEDEVTKWVDNPKNPGKKMPVKEIKKANGFAVFRSIAKDGQGGIGTGTKSEKAASFPDFIEKAESGSIGRALAALGFGTQFTGDDLNEHHRIVDAPVDRSHGASNGNGKPASVAPVPQEKATSAPSQEHGATEPQLVTIHKLCTQLKQPVPVVATFDEAALWISKFNKQLNESRKAS